MYTYKIDSTYLIRFQKESVLINVTTEQHSVLHSVIDNILSNEYDILKNNQKNTFSEILYAVAHQNKTSMKIEWNARIHSRIKTSSQLGMMALGDIEQYYEFVNEECENLIRIDISDKISNRFIYFRSDNLEEVVDLIKIMQIIQS